MPEMSAPTVVAAPVIPATHSPINWTGVAVAIIPLAAAFGFNIEEPYKTLVLTGVPVVGGAAIVVIESFFNKYVTKSSV